MRRAGPCGGMRRAFLDAFWFSLAYAVLGLGLVPLITPSVGEWDNSEAIAMLLCFHAFSACVVLVAAWAVQWAMLRIFRPRSWRGDWWRIPIAAIVAITLAWEGALRNHGSFWKALARGLGLPEGSSLLVMLVFGAVIGMAAGWLAPSMPRPR